MEFRKMVMIGLACCNSWGRKELDTTEQLNWTEPNGCSLEGLMLKLKLQYFGQYSNTDAKSWLIGKDPDAGKDWGQEEKGMTEDRMAGWHHRLNGHGFAWTPGVDDGQGGLECCSSWGHKESDMTEWLNWTELNRSERGSKLMISASTLKNSKSILPQSKQKKGKQWN